MASYTIPESVLGIPLFVPTTNDYFSITAGGMPNGDDHLSIAGATSSNYKAMMNAPELDAGSNCFNRVTYYTESIEWSIVVWLKFDSFTGMVDGDGRYDQILCGVHNAEWSPTLNGNPDYLDGNWSFQAVANGVQFFRPNGRATTADAEYHRINGLSTATWYMFTMTVGPTASTGLLYLDDEVTSSETSDSIVTSVGGTTLTDAKFCIGAYSDTGVPDGAAIDWHMGKFSVHDHILNSTERALLYNAMTA